MPLCFFVFVKPKNLEMNQGPCISNFSNKKNGNESKKLLNAIVFFCFCQAKKIWK
jgi:hypothetical protein